MNGVHKIYFCGSIRGGRENSDTYAKMIDHMKQYGKVLTEHIGNSSLTTEGEKLPNREIHDRDMAWLRESDVMVADVSTPSLGVGYELGRVAEWIDAGRKKDVLCLCRDSQSGVSAMVSGNSSFDIRRYSSIEEAKVIIDGFFRRIDRGH